MKNNKEGRKGIFKLFHSFFDRKKDSMWGISALIIVSTVYFYSCPGGIDSFGSFATVYDYAETTEGEGKEWSVESSWAYDYVEPTEDAGVKLSEHDEDVKLSEFELIDGSSSANLAESFEGDGTEASPYEIKNQSDLRRLARYINHKKSPLRDEYKNKYYKVMKDFSLNTSYDKVIGENDSKAFEGTFDGGGHTISGTEGVDRDTTINGRGFFGVIRGATIKNLTLSSIIINEKLATILTDRVGMLVGEAKGSSTISDCVVTHGDVNGGDKVGGLVGYNHVGSSITKSYASGIIVTSAFSEDDTEYSVGGLVGQNRGSITQSYASGNGIVTSIGAGGANSKVGGLIGYNSGQGTIENSYAIVTITITKATSTQIGGLVGQNKGEIKKSYAGGRLTSFSSASKVGGLVGYNNGKKAYITSSYATGKVTSRNANSLVGGLVGQNTGTIEYSFTYGAIEDESELSLFSGLVGSNTGIVADSYWDETVNTDRNERVTFASSDTDTTHQTTEALQALKTSSIYAQWPDNVWTFAEGEYPQLAWDTTSN